MKRALIIAVLLLSVTAVKSQNIGLLQIEQMQQDNDKAKELKTKKIVMAKQQRRAGRPANKHDIRSISDKFKDLIIEIQQVRQTEDFSNSIYLKGLEKSMKHELNKLELKYDVDRSK